MSENFGPTMSLGAAILLSEQNSTAFSNTIVLIENMSKAAEPIISERTRCSNGILLLAKFLQRSSRKKIMAVLMGQAERATLGEIPAVVDTETVCDPDAFSAFMDGRA